MSLFHNLSFLNAFIRFRAAQAQNKAFRGLDFIDLPRPNLARLGNFHSLKANLLLFEVL